MERVAELERALANGFPSQATVVVYADDTSGGLTIQVSWVRPPMPAGSSGREWRCTVNLGFAPVVLAHYASLGPDARLRVHARLGDLARQEVDARKPRVEDAGIECSAMLDVTAAMIDEAVRGP
ncbi:DUF3022 domain-containing protein [Burkholderia sp. Bp9002]|nr:DUF3022 domain-containing protein [Burkholderia sp. Bp9002]